MLFKDQHYLLGSLFTDTSDGAYLSFYCTQVERVVICGRFNVLCDDHTSLGNPFLPSSLEDVLYESFKCDSVRFLDAAISVAVELLFYIICVHLYILSHYRIMPLLIRNFY